MHILVAGGFDTDNAELKERVRTFCDALGKAVSKHGHVLLNGCRTELDGMIAEATYEDVVARGESDPDKRVISYLLAGLQPLHEYGTIIRSRLTDWDIKGESFYIPEQMQQADVVVLLGGFDGTFRAANWARIAKKPLLPFTAFGGAAEKIYAQELNDFADKYGGRCEQLEYEQLNSVKSDWDERATDLIALAEKVAESRSVLVIMSYGGDPAVEDAFDSFVQVCEDLGYRCERVTQENAGERILPDILARIGQAAFAIVDLTDLKPNVFYELGYADGLGKKVVITAREGTALPFDVKDMPTILWSSQRQLKEDLRKRIISVVKPARASATARLGPR
jgi:hypothetical protein